jgi:DNA-binding transcriptional LysR family regulator
LSQQIRKLEYELDVVLFRRGNDGSHLTPAGEAFMHGAQASLAGAAEAVASARRVGHGECGRLTVGFIGSSADNLIPAALRLYRREHPGVEVSLTEIEPTRLSGCFERSELDVAFVRRPVDDPTLLTEPVTVDDVVAVLPDDHPLSGEESIPLCALARDAWVIAPASVSRASLEVFLADCERVGFKPSIAQEASTPEAIIGLVAAGLGVSTLPRGSHSLPREGVCTVQIEDKKSAVVMAWSEDRRTSAASDFMRLVRQITSTGRSRHATAGSPLLGGSL